MKKFIFYTENFMFDPRNICPAKTVIINQGRINEDREVNGGLFIPFSTENKKGTKYEIELKENIKILTVTPEYIKQNKCSITRRWRDYKTDNILTFFSFNSLSKYGYDGFVLDPSVSEYYNSEMTLSMLNGLFLLDPSNSIKSYTFLEDDKTKYKYLYLIKNDDFETLIKNKEYLNVRFCNIKKYFNSLEDDEIIKFKLSKFIIGCELYSDNRPERLHIESRDEYTILWLSKSRKTFYEEDYCIWDIDGVKSLSDDNLKMSLAYYFDIFSSNRRYKLKISSDFGETWKVFHSSSNNEKIRRYPTDNILKFEIYEKFAKDQNLLEEKDLVSYYLNNIREILSKNDMDDKTKLQLISRIGLLSTESLTKSAKYDFIFTQLMKNYDWIKEVKDDDNISYYINGYPDYRVDIKYSYEPTIWL